VDNFFIGVDSLSNNPGTLSETTVTDDELRTAARGVVSDLQRVATGFVPPPDRPGTVLRLALLSIFLVVQAALFAVYVVWSALRWPVARIASNRRGA
jgi:hypothetical protein